MAQIDMEMKKAFMELKAKVVENRSKLRLADMQIESLKRQNTHAALTETEIKSLPKETRVYQSCGRMFISSDIPTVTKELQEKQELCEGKINTLNDHSQSLQKQIKEIEDNCRELVAQKQAKAESK